MFPCSLSDNAKHFVRAGENVGIYAHVVREEAACQKKYTRYAIMINASLGLQLIFAAAVTAVGAFSIIVVWTYSR